MLLTRIREERATDELLKMPAGRFAWPARIPTLDPRDVEDLEAWAEALRWDDVGGRAGRGFGEEG